jgi:hypothetical protein
MREIDLWEENNEIWHRLLVKWPRDMHSRSQVQVFYIDRKGA